MPTKKTRGRKRRNAPAGNPAKRTRSQDGRMAEQDEEQPVTFNGGTANADAVTNIASGAETPPPHRYTLNQAVMYQEVNRARDIFPLTSNPKLAVPKALRPARTSKAKGTSGANQSKNKLEIFGKKTMSLSETNVLRKAAEVQSEIFKDSDGEAVKHLVNLAFRSNVYKSVGEPPKPPEEWQYVVVGDVSFDEKDGAYISFHQHKARMLKTPDETSLSCVLDLSSKLECTLDKRVYRSNAVEASREMKNLLKNNTSIVFHRILGSTLVYSNIGSRVQVEEATQS